MVLLFLIGFLRAVWGGGCLDLDFWMSLIFSNTFLLFSPLFQSYLLKPHSHLLLNNGISEVFSLVKTLVKNSFNIVAFLIPSITISPLSSIKLPTDSLVLVLD